MTEITIKEKVPLIFKLFSSLDAIQTYASIKDEAVSSGLEVTYFAAAKSNIGKA